MPAHAHAIAARAPTLPDEQARVALLERLNLLDTPPEEIFDRVTRLAALLLDVPIALVSLVDDHRQWFKSRIGLEASETPRDIAFCPHAMAGNDLFVVSDATNDPRFQKNPLVTDAPHIRFYAGMPLRSSHGHALGTLCVIDTKERVLDERQRQGLTDLADIVRMEILQREVLTLSQDRHLADERALDQSKAMFQATFLQAAVGMAVMNLDGRIRQVNACFAAMLGYDVDKMIGRHYSDFIDESNALAAQRDVTAIRDNRIDAYSSERRYRRHDGTVIWLNVSVSLARTADSKPLYLISVVQDITARKQTDAALADLRVDLENRVVARTAQLQNANEELATAIEERDRTLVEQRRVEDALRASRERLQTITDNLPVLIGYIDADLRYRFANATYGDLFGCDVHTLYGTRVEDLVSPELMTELRPYFARALAGERTVNDGIVYNRQSGRVWCSTYIPDRKNGEIAGFYVVSYDVTERKILERTLTEQALQDPLTLLPNRRALLTHLSDAMAADTPFAVLFLDLDGFKQVNDTLGHDSGDILLKQVAERLRANVGKNDLVARLAGDEFVVVQHHAHHIDDRATRLAAHLGLDAAKELAATLLAAVQETFSIQGNVVRVGVSIGIAAHEGGLRPVNASGLLAAADRAMYDAKQNGKQCFRTASEDSVVALSDAMPPTVWHSAR